MAALSSAAGVILVTVLASGCASATAPRPEPFSRTRSHEDRSRGLSGLTISGSAVAAAAQALVGRPYAPGGAGPDRFDCSGLVQYVYGRAGVALPRTVAEQMRVGAEI